MVQQGHRRATFAASLASISLPRQTSRSKSKKQKKKAFKTPSPAFGCCALQSYDKAIPASATVNPASRKARAKYYGVVHVSRIDLLGSRLHALQQFAAVVLLYMTNTNTSCSSPPAPGRSARRASPSRRRSR